MNDLTVKDGAKLVYQILKEAEKRAEPLTQKRIDRAVGYLESQALPSGGKTKEKKEE